MWVVFPLVSPYTLIPTNMKQPVHPQNKNTTTPNSKTKSASPKSPAPRHLGRPLPKPAEGSFSHCSASTWQTVVRRLAALICSGSESAEVAILGAARIGSVVLALALLIFFGEQPGLGMVSRKTRGTRKNHLLVYWMRTPWKMPHFCGCEVDDRHICHGGKLWDAGGCTPKGFRQGLLRLGRALCIFARWCEPSAAPTQLPAGRP